MQLRIVSMLFTETVLTDATLGRKLTNKEKKKAGLSGATSQTEDLSLAGAVWLLLLAAGIHVKLFTPPKANINTYYHSISKHSFAGGDAMKLLVIWRQVMELVYPRDSRDQTQYDKLAACWEQWLAN